MVGTGLKHWLALAAVPLLIVVQSCAADNGPLANVSLPPGFIIEEYAAVPNARSLALGDRGTVFVATRREKSVYAIVDGKQGREVIELADDLATPNGIAFFAGDLYVAEISRIRRYRDIEAQLHAVPAAELLDIALPNESHHGPRYIAFGPDGKLYVTIGAPCNVCERDGFAHILRMNPDGSEQEVFASGVRNSVGLAWHPQSGELWFTDNGRDMLGDDLPSCELNHAPRPGLNFGFPYCHAGEILDPEYGAGKHCADYVAPAQKLGPHVAPLGLAFYTGTEFPAAYQGQIFIAEHGSWNRSKKIGYRISLVRLRAGEAVGYEVFADGWLQGETVHGRPVDLLVLADGSLLVSDDHAGRVYRIRYAGQDRT